MRPLLLLFLPLLIQPSAAESTKFAYVTRQATTIFNITRSETATEPECKNLCDGRETCDAMDLAQPVDRGDECEGYQECHFTDLPNDVIAHLLLYLNAIDRAKLGSTCRIIRSVDNAVGGRLFSWVVLEVLESSIFLLCEDTGRSGSQHYINYTEYEDLEIADYIFRLFKRSHINRLQIEIHARPRFDPRIINVFSTTKYDRLDLCMEKGQFCEINFLSSLVKDRDLSKSELYLDVQTSQQHEACIEIFKKIQNIHLVRFNRRMPCCLDGQKSADIADATLLSLVSRSETVELHMHEFSCQGLVEAFKIICSADTHKSAILTARESVVLETEEILRNFPSMWHRRNAFTHTASGSEFLKISDYTKIDTDLVKIVMALVKIEP